MSCRTEQDKSHKDTESRDIEKKNDQVVLWRVDGKILDSCTEVEVVMNP